MKSLYARMAWIGGVLLLLFALSACGSGDTEAGSQETESQEESTNAEDGTSAPSSEEEQKAESGTRTVEHAMEETEVPAQPERVVVLDNGALDNSLALGVKPIGAPTVFLDQPFFSYLEDQAEGIQKIGTIDQPSLETIASLNPDVIIGNKDTNEKIYDKLKQIAPTILAPTIGATWKENLNVVAEALGKTEKAEQLMQDYEDRKQEFQQALGDQLEETTVSILRPRADQVRIYLSQSFSGQIIQDMGLPRPEAQQEDKFARHVTEEQIETLDGDVIFWFSRDPENILEKRIKDKPLWKTLQAVKDDEVHRVSPETWLSGMGIQSVNLVVDDLFKYLVEEE